MLEGPQGLFAELNYWKSRGDSKEFPGIVLHLGDSIHPSIRQSCLKEGPTMCEALCVALEYTSNIQALFCKSSQEAGSGPQGLYWEEKKESLE